MLKSKKVEEIFMDCLFKEGEDTSNHIKVEGIVHNVGFNPERVLKHADEIESMLNELPDTFKQSVGGGNSFLNACVDKDGNQWTSLHQIMEQLFLLGIAAKKAAWVLPKDMWNVLPGGMPYVVVNN